MTNEFKRMQKLAGIITESQLNKKTIKSKRFLKENDENLLSQNDLNELEEAILDVYQDWLDLDDHADEGGYVWDTEYHDWVNLYDFVISMIYRGVNPSFLAKLESKIQNVKNDDGSQMGLTDYIETYHDDWIQNVEKAIREDIPTYFEDEEDINENQDEFPYFEKWKKSIINHLQKFDPEDHDVDINMFSKMTDPYDAIDYLIEKEYLYDNDLDRSTNVNYIKTGEYTEDINEGDTDYNRAKDAKRLGKKGEKNIYGAGVKKGEKIEKKKMKMSELKAAIKALAEGEDDININDDKSLYDPVYEAKKDKEVEDIKDVDVTVGDEETTTDIVTTDVDPDVKAVQDALTQAQAAAEKLGDEKLTDQIGNTITFFTRTHIVDKPTMTTEVNIKKRINKLIKSL